MVEVMKIMATSFKRFHACTTAHSVPSPAAGHLPTHPSTGDSWTLMGKSGSVSCGVTAPFSWFLVCTRFCLCPPRVSVRVVGQWWPAARSGALSAAVHAWDLLKEVIIFIISTIVWPQVKQQGGNTALPIKRKLD